MEKRYEDDPERLAFFKRNADDVRQSAAVLISDLGGKVMVIGSPKQRNVHKELGFDKALSLARQAFSECA